MKNLSRAERHFKLKDISNYCNFKQDSLTDLSVLNFGVFYLKRSWKLFIALILINESEKTNWSAVLRHCCTTLQKSIYIHSSSKKNLLSAQLLGLEAALVLKKNLLKLVFFNNLISKGKKKLWTGGYHDTFISKIQK